MAMRRFGLAIAPTVLILDQASKAWILYGLDLPSRGQVDVLPFFSLTMVWNRGVSFGLLAADSSLAKWLLIGFSLAVVGYLLVWLKSATSRITAIAIGMIVGGALGNVLDRLIYGAVADFLDFDKLFFPWVFNLADAGITLGVVTLAGQMLLGRGVKHQPVETDRSPE